jgi:glutamyl-tRNA reductase
VPAALRAADLVVTATGATGVIVDRDTVSAALAQRADRPLFVLDLALPRDVDPAVAALDGVTLVDLETLKGALSTAEVGEEVEAVRRIVAEEVGAFLAWQRSVRVAPTVVALRTRAAEVVEAELARLYTRLPELDPLAHAEVGLAMNRLVDKLLHTPTVRVKQLAQVPGGEHYTEALRELFGLDPGAAAAVATADVTVEEAP